MMKIVVAHNRYVSAVPSGENQIVSDEIAILRASGHEVHPYLRDSDEIAKFRGRKRAELAIRPIRSREDVGAFSRLLLDVRPDVVHLHNPYPLISPWIVRVAAEMNIPVVQSVYNYRMSCVAGSFFRDGSPCEDCLGKSVPWPAVFHGCYRGSRTQSVPMAVALSTHRKTWETVDRFLALSSFMADKLRAAGIRDSQITIRPNAAEDPGPPTPIGKGFLFAGRFDQQKGILLLLDAWRRSGLGHQDTLVIAGHGALAPEIQRISAGLDGVTLVGSVDRSDVGRLMTRAAVVVVPSIWYEGFPQIVVEAFARARPVLGTNVGALAELIDDTVGWSAQPDAADLARTLVEVSGTNASDRGAAARRRYEERYTPEVVLEQLLAIYTSVRR